MTVKAGELVLDPVTDFDVTMPDDITERWNENRFRRRQG